MEKAVAQGAEAESIASGLSIKGGQGGFSPSWNSLFTHGRLSPWVRLPLGDFLFGFLSLGAFLPEFLSPPWTKSNESSGNQQALLNKSDSQDIDDQEPIDDNDLLQLDNAFNTQDRAFQSILIDIGLMDATESFNNVNEQASAADSIEIEPYDNEDYDVEELLKATAVLWSDNLFRVCVVCFVIFFLLAAVRFCSKINVKSSDQRIDSFHERSSSVGTSWENAFVT